MPFEVSDKVALISGGASGIGFKVAQELLENGLRGVTIADVNDTFGKQAVADIENEFGPNKAIYVKTDVRNMQSYEEAFKRTINKFKNLDILVNNAGILNDAIWEEEIEVNFKGVVHGILLALEKYIPQYRTSAEGVIVNMSSNAGVTPFSTIPIYTGTKFAVMGMTKAFGDEDHYKQTKIKVIALCPGATETPLFNEMSGRNLGPRYQAILERYTPPSQGAEIVAQAMVNIVKNAPSGTVWVVEDGKPPYEFILPPRENFAK